ncbi:MAG TPA: hypothetical protein VFP92_03650 [Rhodanobacteraceae bacterium]|nr:hypothetical protein [Rhodanobacteraceae bacterium]
MTTNEESSFSMVVEGQHMAHHLVLKALVATHPNPDLLRKAIDLFDAEADEFFANDATDALQLQFYKTTLASLTAQIDG